MNTPHQSVLYESAEASIRILPFIIAIINKSFFECAVPIYFKMALVRSLKKKRIQRWKVIEISVDDPEDSG